MVTIEKKPAAVEEFMLRKALSVLKVGCVRDSVTGGLVATDLCLVWMIKYARADLAVLDLTLTSALVVTLGIGGGWAIGFLLRGEVEHYPRAVRAAARSVLDFARAIIAI